MVTRSLRGMSLTRLGARILAPLPRDCMLVVSVQSVQTIGGSAPHVLGRVRAMLICWTRFEGGIQLLEMYRCQTEEVQRWMDLAQAAVTTRIFTLFVPAVLKPFAEPAILGDASISPGYVRRGS